MMTGESSIEVKSKTTGKGFETVWEKTEVLTKGQKQDITGMYMDPTGNHHVPLKYFFFPALVITSYL